MVFYGRGGHLPVTLWCLAFAARRAQRQTCRLSCVGVGGASRRELGRCLSHRQEYFGSPSQFSWNLLIHCFCGC